MEIRRLDLQTIGLCRVEPAVLAWLEQIPVAADPGDHAQARARLYSSPGKAAGLEDDWKNYVEPELRSLFESSLDVFIRDLESRIASPDGTAEVHVPIEHVDHWLRSLNQARLVLTEKHALSEQELAGGFPDSIAATRDVACFHVHFFGLIQEALLEQVRHP